MRRVKTGKKTLYSNLLSLKLENYQPQ